MSFPAFDPALFPPLPANRYDTLAVFLEPMAGSGERFAVCAAAQGGDGFAVEPLISENVVRCLYGAKAKGFLGLLDTLAGNLRNHLNAGQALARWQPPLSGVFLGEPMPAWGNSPRQAVAAVAALHASLCRMPALAGVTDDTQPVESEDLGLKAWVRQVQNRALQRLPELEINRLAPLGEGDSVALHLAGPQRAGLIGLLTPEGLSQRANDAKVKLWNLEHLPEAYHQRELLLGVPRADDPNMADEIVRGRVRGKIDALRIQAEASHIKLLTAHNAEEAALALAA